MFVSVRVDWNIRNIRNYNAVQFNSNTNSLQNDHKAESTPLEKKTLFIMLLELL